MEEEVRIWMASGNQPKDDGRSSAAEPVEGGKAFCSFLLFFFGAGKRVVGSLKKSERNVSRIVKEERKSVS